MSLPLLKCLGVLTPIGIYRIVEKLDNILTSLEEEKNKVQIKYEILLNQVINTTIDQVLRSVDKAFNEYLLLMKQNPDIKKNNYKLARKTRYNHNNIIAEFRIPPLEYSAIEANTNLYVVKEKSKTKIQNYITAGVENVLMKVTTSEDIKRRLE